MKEKNISYSDAILEATDQAMAYNEKVIILGQLSDMPSGIFGTTRGLAEKYGSERVKDFPIAENLMTCTAMGASLTGLIPIIIHQRLDFMMYSLDAIVNWLSLWYFKSGSKSNMPIVIRAIVGKGWGQGPQHSKSLHNWFAHLPGIRVAMPATAFDAKGLLINCIFNKSPTIIIENRSLFSMKDKVPDEMYALQFGKAKIHKFGKDITLVSLGSMLPQSLRVANALLENNIDIEVIDLRCIYPYDKLQILESVKKTKRLIVLDPSWFSFGSGSEIIATVVESLGNLLLSNPVRISFPDSHTPMSTNLEKEFYPRDPVVAKTILDIFKS